MVRLRFVAWVLFLAWPVSAMGQCPIAEVFTSDGRSVGDPLSMREGRVLALRRTLDGHLPRKVRCGLVESKRTESDVLAFRDQDDPRSSSGRLVARVSTAGAARQINRCE